LRAGEIVPEQAIGRVGPQRLFEIGHRLVAVRPGLNRTSPAMWIMSALEAAAPAPCPQAIASAFRPACEAANASRFSTSASD
jgi:hypothetical protein